MCPVSSSGLARRMGKTSTVSPSGQDDDSLEITGQTECVMVTQPEDVLVIGLGNQINECPGMMSEAKVCSDFHMNTLYFYKYLWYFSCYFLK